MKSAKSIVHAGQAGSTALSQTPHKMLYSSDDPLPTLLEKQKIALLQKIDRLARAKDPRVCDVMASVSGSHETILMLNQEGQMTADVRPLVSVRLTVIAQSKEGGHREQGSGGGGARVDFAYFDDEMIESYIDKAVRQALTNLEAVDAPAGTMPVVLGPGWPGVLLHEAVGHGLEGDFNRKGSSTYSGRVGELVASELCTVVDDGTIPGRRGSLNIDDEGCQTQRNVLIEKGRLVGYMQDQQNAKLMGVKPTGNGRRESYGYAPMPRMTNTFMLDGESEPDEIIASVKRGLYAVDFSGGQVDITSGQFVFTASEAYIIEDGKVTQPVKGATLIGNGPDALQKISMVGNDLALDTGIGVCGKAGQSVPVGVGQPTLKVDTLTVGGKK